MKLVQRARRCIGTWVAFVLAAVAMVGAVDAAPVSTDVTDVWWNANKSGNGYLLVNTGTFVFATAYLFGADRNPFWVSAELQSTGGATLTFTGPVYVSSGPPFGGSYDPATVNARQAGTMTFLATSSDAGRIDLSIDGVTTSEAVQRQPLTLDTYDGLYVGVLAQTSTGCTYPPNNGNESVFLGMYFSQAGPTMSIRSVDENNVRCSASGVYSQLGRNGKFQGTYTCDNADAGSTTWFEMNNRADLFSAQTLVNSTTWGCTTKGRVTGVVPLL